MNLLYGYRFIYIWCENKLYVFPIHFDTSAYSKENANNFPLKDKNVLGMMKDEYNGKVIREFISLQAKVYSVKIYIIDKEIKKLKALEIV